MGPQHVRGTILELAPGGAERACRIPQGLRAVRVKSRWKGGAPKSLEENAGALAYIAWRIATEGAQNIQTAGWEIHSAAQRLDVIGEFVAFLTQSADRLVYIRMSDEERQRFITELAIRLAGTMQDNQMDVLGLGDNRGDHRAAFIAKLNQRFQDYSELDFTDEGPSYAFLRYFADKVADLMGEKDKPWTHAEVIEIEAPKAVKTLKKAMQDLFSTSGAPG
jgi:hypothetical protein